MNYRLLLFFITLGFVQVSLSAPLPDSLRTEKIKGKKYIIHRVEPKETLYAISKRYNVSAEDLKKQNPSLNNGLKMYDELRIPVTRKKKRQETATPKSTTNDFHIVQPGETLFAISRKYEISVDSLISRNGLKDANLDIGDTLNISSIIKPEPVDKPSSEGRQYHVVQASETLFGISRTYQVEIEDLQHWNQLDNYSLSIGQKLIVSGQPVTKATDSLHTSSVIKKEAAPIPEKTKKPPLDTLYVKTDNSQFKTKTKEVEGQKRILEEGFAMKIEDTEYTKKYLVLHRTAPLGSTIQVTSQMTHQTIDARVVGKLPESAMNQKLLMRLSAAAYQALGARDLKTPVTVSYPESE